MGFLHCSICSPYGEIKKLWNTSLVPIQWVKPHDATKMPQLLCVKLEDPKNFTSQALRRSRAVIHLIRPRRDPSEGAPASAAGHEPDQLTVSQPDTGPPRPYPTPAAFDSKRCRWRGSRREAGCGGAVHKPDRTRPEATSRPGGPGKSPQF